MWKMWDLILAGAGTAIVGVAYMPLEQKGAQKESVIRAKRVELSNGTGRAEITLSDSGKIKLKMWKESGGRFGMLLGDTMRLVMYTKGGGVFEITKDESGMYVAVGQGKRRVLMSKWPGFCGFGMSSAEGRFVFRLGDSLQSTTKLTLYGNNEEAAVSAGSNAEGGWIRTFDRNGRPVFHLGAEDAGGRTVALHDIEGRNVFSVASTQKAVWATVGNKGWESAESLEFGEDGKLRRKPVPLRKDEK